MEVDNLSAQRQADASPWVRVTRMEPLKYHENPLSVGGFDSDSIVLTGELPLAAVLFGREPDGRGYVDAAELDRVGHQVREELDQQGSVAGDDGQPVDGDRGVTILDRGFELGHGFAGYFVEVNWAEVGARLADP